MKIFDKQWWRELYEFLVVALVVILLGAWGDNYIKEEGTITDNKLLWCKIFSIIIILGIIIFIVWV